MSSTVLKQASVVDFKLNVHNRATIAVSHKQDPEAYIELTLDKDDERKLIEFVSELCTEREKR